MFKPIKILHAFHKNYIHILAYTTGVCNYTCRYCSYGNMRNSSFLDLSKLSNFVKRLYIARKLNIYLELIGGEPTLDKNILDFVKDLYSFSKNIQIGIYTNFSLDIELYIELAKHNVDLTLTWHSLNIDLHNRLFIEKAIKLLSLNINDNIDVHVMYENHAIDESKNAFLSIVDKYPYNTELCLLDRDFSTNQIYFVNEYYSLDALDEYLLLKLKSKIGDNKKIYRIKYNDNVERIQSVQDIYDKAEFYNFKYWKCDAGLNYFYIDINGNIYPCFQYCIDKQNIIGNIYASIDSINFKLIICKYNNCPCVWEAYKEKVFNYDNN